jgi:hypothetical protein
MRHLAGGRLARAGDRVGNPKLEFIDVGGVGAARLTRSR